MISLIVAIRGTHDQIVAVLCSDIWASLTVWSLEISISSCWQLSPFSVPQIPFLNLDQGSLFSGLSLDKGFCWVPWSLTSLILGATGRGPWTDLGLLWLLWTPRRTSIFISRSFICMPWILSYLYYFFHILCLFPIPVTLLFPSSCSNSFRVFLRLSLNWYFLPQSSPPVTLRIVNCWIVRKFASWLISHRWFQLGHDRVTINHPSLYQNYC